MHLYTVTFAIDLDLQNSDCNYVNCEQQSKCSPDIVLSHEQESGAQLLTKYATKGFG